MVTPIKISLNILTEYYYCEKCQKVSLLSLFDYNSFMYQKTTCASELNCDQCNKSIPAGTAYFDDSTYNSLYAKVDIQKILCFECGSTYLEEVERQYQEYERRERPKRLKRFIGMVLLFGAIVILLSHLHLD